jgi:anti-anti-sigma factor
MSHPAIVATEHAQDVLIVVPLRDVDPPSEQTAASEVDALLEQLRGPECRGVVIDFANLSCIASSLLAQVVKIWRTLRADRKKLALCNVPETGREILRTTRLDSLWPISVSRTSALRTVARDAGCCGSEN